MSALPYPAGNYAEVGPMITGADVESAVEATLREWLAPYLSECDALHGLARGTTAAPRGWAVTGRDLQKLTSDQLPCVVIMAGGITQPPTKFGGHGAYTAFWGVDIGSVFNAAWGRESRRHAQFYAAAIRVAMLQCPLASDDVTFASVDWRGETYDEMDFADSRSYSASVVGFNVEVRDVADANGGPPPSSSAPVDPTEPFTPWIEVVETSVTVTNTPPDGT